jgi:hypothetical protein
MTDAEVMLPVRCPQCGQQSLAEFRFGVVAEGLQTRQMRLYAHCHLASWDASEFELERMRAHLDELWNDGWLFASSDLDAALAESA